MVAIGECGLDLLNNEQLSLQIEIFNSQIKLANEFHLPLIIHCRQLDQQLFDILKQSVLDLSIKIQWHCCHSKGVNVYREFLKYFPSSLLSIGGMCCHSGEKNLQKLIKELYESENNENQRRFVFETDSPYLKSSLLLINTEDNCPILGTLTASAYLTKNVLKNDQWTNNLKINTTILQQFFNLT
jgi:TatD DNase family protein